MSRFSSDGPDANSSTRLDQAAAGDEEIAGDEGEEASGHAEAGAASAGENGDGEYSDGVAVYAPASGGTANTTPPSAGGGGGSTSTTAAPSPGATPVDVTITGTITVT